jgi:hypothetical protein
MNAATSTDSPLLFQWEAPRRRRFAITIFLIGSLAAHALCFYVFQIVYPPPVALLPPPARVSLITPGSEQGQTLLRWLHAEDPALTFATDRPPEARLAALPKIEHVPSYLTTGPILKQPPPLVVDLRMPSPQPPDAVPITRPALTASPSIIPTTVSFSENFAPFGVPKLPAPQFIASSNEPPENVQFRIAVAASGEIRYCFALNSSGDQALDEQARQHLLLCRFASHRDTKSGNGDSLIWGIATIEWGNDVARPATATPSP